MKGFLDSQGKQQELTVKRAERYEGQQQQYEQKGGHLFMWNGFDKVMAYCGMFFLSFCQIQFMWISTELTQNEPGLRGVTKSYFGLYKDTSDGQWNAYSGNIQVLLVCILVFLGLSHVIRSSKLNQQNNYRPLLFFFIVFGFFYTGFLFRSGIIWYVLLTSLNYVFIARFSAWKHFQITFWIIQIATLFINDSVIRHIRYERVFFFSDSLGKFFQEFSHGAPVSWYNVYNMTMLRMISFAMDKSWAHQQKRQQTKNEHLQTCKVCDKDVKCLRYRIEFPQNLNCYEVVHFFAYLFYTPIFITGPPASFNSWASQVYFPQNTHSQRDKIKYTLRCIAVFFVFQVWLHFQHAFAISTIPENKPYWENLSVFQLFAMGYSALMLIWFKFDTIWKIARCWALWDGIEVHENMNRCMNNNYNMEGFWRAWHRGFNQWLIRYLFVPLGGSKSKNWSMWVVFTFVAIWHDLNLNLLFWAWGVCLTFVPEVALRTVIKKPKFAYLWKKRWWLYACGLAGGIGILFLITTNLIGFGIGYKLMGVVIAKMANLSQFYELLFIIFGLSLGAIGQFRVRHFENDSKGY